MEPHFLYARYAPSPPARSAVEDYWVVQAERCRAAIESALPDAALAIYFNLGPGGRHIVQPGTSRRLPRRAAWVSGPRTSTLLIEKETRDCDIVGVRLHPGVAMALFGVPASELRDALVDLDLLWGSAVEGVRDRLATCDGMRARITVIERILLHRLARAGGDDPVPIRALGESVAELPNASVGSVARAHGFTHRQVITLFDTHVGLKPSTYRRVQRMRRVLRAVHAPERTTWASIAAGAGYVDQAHLIHDFRKLTGLTPGEYDAKRTGAGIGYAVHTLATER